MISRRGTNAAEIPGSKFVEDVCGDPFSDFDFFQVHDKLESVGTTLKLINGPSDGGPPVAHQP